MKLAFDREAAKRSLGPAAAAVLGAFLFAGFIELGVPKLLPTGASDAAAVAEEVPEEPRLDREEYDRRMRRLAHLPDGFTLSASDTPPLWPAEAAYPNAGALLPFHRIVAYYGNFFSTRMGVLGEYREETVLEMLMREVKAWEEADPETPVLPAIDYIAVVAQASAGSDGKFRARMPHTEIDKAVAMAEKVGGIVILEVQPGLSPLMEEVRTLEPYLARPDVHLAIDPEFVMIKTGARPGTRVGTVDASDVNEAAGYLAALAREHGLPPKVLVVHRYTRHMVTNAAEIRPLPEVQIVMDMDGWGRPESKFATYNAFIRPEPVQFTGFKLFYKNDVRWQGSRLLTPAEILELMPRPIFIQYQ